MSGVWLRGGDVQRWWWRCALCAAFGSATSQQAAEAQFWWHYHTRHSKPHRGRGAAALRSGSEATTAV